MSNQTAPPDMFVSDNPGRDVQRVGTAHHLGEPPELIHADAWGVLGTLGESQCYLGVRAKVDAVHTALSAHVRRHGIQARLVAPAFTLGVSDGQLNGTSRMRYSLISREVVRDATELHLRATDLRAAIAVVACDKPPMGTLAALLEHNAPAIVVPDGSIRPGVDPESGARLDLVAAFQCAGDPDDGLRTRVALHACPGQGSCGGMYTYNTMQVFAAVAGMTPLEYVSPPSDDERRISAFPPELAAHLANAAAQDRRPRDIVTPGAIRNALTVTIAMGGSTNVVLHAAELARAAGLDLWRDVISQPDLRALTRSVPLLADLRPFGEWSMVDLDAVGGLAVVVRTLLDRDVLDGEAVTCTGETLAQQVSSLAPPAPDGTVVYPADRPFKRGGGLRILQGNLAPDGGAVLKVAGLEHELEGGVFRGRARVFDGEAALLEAITSTPDAFQDGDMVVIRYEGPRGAPGMPEMLDPTSRITALCRQRDITVGLMTDARFSGGSVGLVIGHVSPEAFLGGPIALVRDGDTIVVDLEADRIDCIELDDPACAVEREDEWRAAVADDGHHPAASAVDSTLLARMRAGARPPLEGAGLAATWIAPLGR